MTVAGRSAAMRASPRMLRRVMIDLQLGNSGLKVLRLELLRCYGLIASETYLMEYRIELEKVMC